MNENFCPAPWVSLFYQYNTASPCCANVPETLTISPTEFKKSNTLLKIKEEFLKGTMPESCKGCLKSEKAGLRSIREYYQNRYPQIDINQNTIKQLELRASNLCNFKCRMCNGIDSIEIEKESNPLAKVTEITDSNWEEIKLLCHDLEFLTLTGGEPMLIKKYYELLDYLIEQRLNKNIRLHIYTNCSVYNPKFIERLFEFDNVMLNLSLDAVGKIAEYQRHGTNWNTVESNVLKLVSLSKIKSFSVHTTMTAYNILGISDMADFLLQIKAINENLFFKIHTVKSTVLQVSNLPEDLKYVALDQINSAIDKLSSNSFNEYVKELKSIKKELFCTSNNAQLFNKFTKNLDLRRKESFESTFGYKLY